MGVDSRRPILPAPTESIVASTTATDLATDLSRRTDKTSYSIPDDGSPVTIPTPSSKHRSSRGNHDAKLSASPHHHSQTSLLIEYFEGGKGSGGLVSRPSVRVRVTPSSGRKANKDHHEHNIHITEGGSGARQPTYTRRISFSSPSRHKAPPAVVDDQSVTSSTSATDDPAPRAHQDPPVEIELMDRDPGSELSARSRYVHLPSDISSMPADSMLDSTSAVRRKRSTSQERDPEPGADEYLKTPSRRRSRSPSHERIAHRVAEKLSSEPREPTSRGKTHRHHRARTARRDPAERHGSDRTAPHHHHQSADDEMSPVSSLLSASGVSSHRKSGDQYSFRSGTSKSSINNPKLLETVEDAIRRLILPELKELKKDQRVASNSSKFERDMSASYSSAGGGAELSRRLSKHASAPDVRKPTVVLHRDDGPEDGIVLAGDSGSSSQRDRRASRDSDTTVDGNPVKWGLRPELTEQDKLRRQRSKGLREAEKAGRVGSALTAAALRHHDSRSSLDREEEGSVRRPSGSRSRTGSGNETELVFRKHNVAPMPLRSAIESDLTRDSLLSERTVEPAGSRHDLGLHHSNLSSHNLSIHSASDQDPHDHRGASPVGDAAAGAIAAAAAANLLEGADGDRDARRRTLSPIQSVASDHSASPLRPGPADHAVEPRLSIDSLSSAPSTNLARSTRQGNSSVASQAELRKNYTDRGPELGYEESSGLSPHEHPWPTFAGGDDVDPRYSQAETTSTDGKRWTADYTDDSEVNYLEKAHQARPVAPGSGTNPQFVQPIAVESAVASLDPSILDPSLVDAKSNPSGVDRSQGHLPQLDTPRSPERVDAGSRQGSPLKQQQDAASPDATSFPRRMGASSPPQSVTQSLEDPQGFADDLHSRSPSPEEDAQSPDLESEINTNPSIIQGPAAPHENHWYGQTDPTGHQSPHDQTRAGLDYGQDDYSPAGYSPNGFYDRYPRDQLFGTPPGAKDEGYVSAANPRSPGADTPEPLNKGFDMDSGAMGLFDSGPDPFAPGHHRQLSGYSHGAGSPLYDSATGRGIERIQSKDIVALMDHLTVRDAQRNARDTEILMTLVQSATEMRNSFEGMKKFIAQQDGLAMEANERQHERTYRAVGGPRPLPAHTRPRTAADPEDLRSKRMNVFKRAMKGLHLKSGNDLSKIEEMLEQLLDEVEALRYGDDRMARSSHRTGSVDPEGYEPEGQAGTTSSENHSGYLSMFSRPPDGRGPGPADQRVSTVPEADEAEDTHARGEFLSPNLPGGGNGTQAERPGSEPTMTPPRAPVASGALSTEHTPKSTEKARKHKSSSSSFFPKISRWSKTTASSMGDNIRNSIQPARKDRGGSFEASRSGSDLGRGSYDAAGDDRMRTSYSLDENRPPSPLVPSQVSEAPKYRAHRDSLDMQHPQPRPGPTGRYQSQLETQAQVYDAPAEPWGSVGSANQRYSGGSRLSPISDVYSEKSSRMGAAGPPRPPKIKDEGPLIPERPPKVAEGDERSYVERVQSSRSSPRSTPNRKPTGPRPLTGSQSSPRKRSQYRGSPDQIDDEYGY